MKNYLYIFSIILFFASCGGAEQEQHPQDLAGKKTLLKEKKTAFRSLEKEIKQLEGEILALEPNQEKARTLVTTQMIKPTNFDHYVEIQGSVEADDFVGASSEVGGRIIDLRVQEGQAISKGSLIARLDLEQLDKQIAEIEKSLELAEEVFERQKRLWDQNIGSEIQFLQAKNNKERLEKSLETIRFQQTKANVYAPISGVVETLLLKAGELASPGMPIVQILNTNKIKVVAAVPETYLKAVRKGERVSIHFPAIDLEKTARISLIGRTINPANRTFDIEINISNSGGLLKPNLLAIVKINDFSKKNALSIPLELVQQEVSGKDFVFIKGKGEDGAFAEKIYVKTGESYEGKIVIEEGLKGSEEIIVDGARNLRENDLIKVQESQGSDVQSLK